MQGHHDRANRCRTMPGTRHAGREQAARMRREQTAPGQGLDRAGEAGARVEGPRRARPCTTPHHGRQRRGSVGGRAAPCHGRPRLHRATRRAHARAPRRDGGHAGRRGATPGSRGQASSRAGHVGPSSTPGELAGRAVPRAKPRATPGRHGRTSARKKRRTGEGGRSGSPRRTTDGRRDVGRAMELDDSLCGREARTSELRRRERKACVVRLEEMHRGDLGRL